MSWPCFIRGHSTAIGSFTLKIISALAHTSSAVGRIVAPAATYAESGNPLPSPAPCSTCTVCPCPTSDSTPAGTSATRFSLVLISFGTPMIIVQTPVRVSGLVCRGAGSGERERRGGARSPLTADRSPSWSQLEHGLPGGIEELRGDRRDLVRRDRLDLAEEIVHRPPRLRVEREGRQAVHPAGRALQRQ